MKADWNTTDRIFYGIMCSGVMLWAIAMFIEACRSRPKVQMLVLGTKAKQKEVKQSKPDESSSAADNQ